MVHLVELGRQNCSFLPPHFSLCRAKAPSKMVQNKTAPFGATLLFMATGHGCCWSQSDSRTKRTTTSVLVWPWGHRKDDTAETEESRKEPFSLPGKQQRRNLCFCAIRLRKGFAITVDSRYIKLQGDHKTRSLIYR